MIATKIARKMEQAKNGSRSGKDAATYKFMDLYLSTAGKDQEKL